VFVDYTHQVSLWYYGFLAISIVFITESILYFDFNIFRFLLYYLEFLKSITFIVITFLKNMFVYIFKELFHYKQSVSIDEEFLAIDLKTSNTSLMGDNTDRQKNSSKNSTKGNKGGSSALGGLYKGNIPTSKTSAGLKGLYNSPKGKERIGSSLGDSRSKTIPVISTRQPSIPIENNSRLSEENMGGNVTQSQYLQPSFNNQDSSRNTPVSRTSRSIGVFINSDNVPTEHVYEDNPIPPKAPRQKALSTPSTNSPLFPSEEFGSGQATSKPRISPNSSHIDSGNKLYSAEEYDKLYREY